MDARANPISGRLVMGLALVAAGVLWTLDNLGYTDADQILRWWPVLLLAVGLMKLTGVGMDKQTSLGAFLTIAGALLLLDEAGVVNVSFRILWPLLFIFMGVQITLRALRGGAAGPAAAGADADDYVRSFAVMGAVTRRNDSQTFRGGELTAVMGGIELDLTNAIPAGGRAVVDLFAIWGGIDIRVPEDWRVEIDATPVMGAVESKARVTPGIEPIGTLVLRGLVIMGGVEIKHGPLGGGHSGVFVQVGRGGRRGDRREGRSDDEGVRVQREYRPERPDDPKGPVDPR